MTPHILGYVYLVVGELYMLASTVSSKILLTIGNKEGFQFEVMEVTGTSSAMHVNYIGNVVSFSLLQVNLISCSGVIISADPFNLYISLLKLVKIYLKISGNFDRIQMDGKFDYNSTKAGQKSIVCL